MNFQELLQRMNQLEHPVVEEPNEGNAYGQAVQNTPPGEEIKIDGKGTGDIKREEVVADECGMGPASPMGQQDNVNMSVNMNGSGAGGIKDLLDILRNLESGDAGEDELGVMIGKMDQSKKEPLIGGDEMSVDEFANSPDATGMADPVYAPRDAATPSGDDLHRSHGAYAATQLGDNPMAIQERLAALYEEIKGR